MSATIPIPEDYGAAGDGITDDRTALQNALSAGLGPVYLARHKQYAFGQRLEVPSYGGFFGGGRLLMLTASGKFDCVNYSNNFGNNQLGVDVSAKTKPIIDCQIDMDVSAGTAIRTCTPLSVRNCDDPEINLHFSGFKEGAIPYFSYNSNRRGKVFVNGHDCTASSTSLPSMQMTVFSVDGDRAMVASAAVNSIGLVFDAIVDNITLSSAAVSAYTDQTDGVDLGPGNESLGAVGRISYNNVAEPLDVFSHCNIVDVAGKKARNLIAKYGHGASFNQLRGTADGFGLAGVDAYGSNDAGANYNTGTITGQGGGTIGSWLTSDAILFDGNSATFKPTNNMFKCLVKGDGVHQTRIANMGAGSNNTALDLGSTGWVSAHSVIASADNNNLVKCANGTHIKAYDASVGSISGGVSGTVAPFDNVMTDNQGAFNTTTHKYTAKKCERVIFYAQVRTVGLAAGKYLQIRLRKNGTDITTSQSTNYGTSTSDAAVSSQLVMDLVAGDALDALLVYNQAGSLSIRNTSNETYMTIDEI